MVSKEIHVAYPVVTRLVRYRDTSVSTVTAPLLTATRVSTCVSGVSSHRVPYCARCLIWCRSLSFSPLTVESRSPFWRDVFTTTRFRV